MNTLTLFKDSLFKFSDLSRAKKMPFGKVILYIIFLSMVLAIPITKQIFSIMHDIKNDGQKIAAKLPEFEIKDGKFQTSAATKGFIYQTNSIIFTFDPQGKRALSDIAADSVGSTIGIGFLEDEFVIALPGSGMTDSLLGANQLEVPYKKGTLDGLNSKNLKKALDESSVPFWIKLVIFFVTLYPTFLNLLINLILIAFGANLYARIRRYRLRFFDCLKISAYCATLPVILSSLIHFFNQSFDDSYLIIFTSLLIFFFALKNEERQPLV
jgi:maltodextrin utilization protein YvdJ